MINEINDFKTIKEVDKETIEKYRGKLPDEYLDIWQEHGCGTFYGGYLKIIDPEDYRDLLENSYFLGNRAIPFLATAFGDLIIWEDNKYVVIVKYRYGERSVIESGFDFFMDDILFGVLDEKYLSIKQYDAAVKKYGELEYDECFGYVPLLALGGKESVDNLKKVKMKEHIELIYSMVGGI